PLRKAPGQGCLKAVSSSASSCSLLSRQLEFRIGCFRGLGRCGIEVGEFQAQVAGVCGVTQRDIKVYRPSSNELFDLAIEVLHAFGAADTHGIKQGFAIAFALLNVLTSAQGGFQDLEHCHAAFAVLAREQPLGYEVAE